MFDPSCLAHLYISALSVPILRVSPRPELFLRNVDSLMKTANSEHVGDALCVAMEVRGTLRRLRAPLPLKQPRPYHGSLKSARLARWTNICCACQPVFLMLWCQCRSRLGRNELVSGFWVVRGITAEHCWRLTLASGAPKKHVFVKGIADICKSTGRSETHGKTDAFHVEMWRHRWLWTKISLCANVHVQKCFAVYVCFHMFWG